MWVPIVGRRRGPVNRVAAIAAGLVGAGTLLYKDASSSRHGAVTSGAAGAPAASLWVVIVIAMLAAVALVAIAVQRRAACEDRQADGDRAGHSSRRRDDSEQDSSDDDHSGVILFAIGMAIVALLALFLLGVFSNEAAAQHASTQDGATQWGFVMTKGSDTLAVERLTQGRSSVSGDLTLRGQGTISFTADFAGPARITGLTMTVRLPGAPLDAPPVQSVAMRFANDSAFLEATAGGNTQRLARATGPSVLPIINNDFALIEAFVRQAWMQRPAKYAGRMFATTGGVALDATVEFIAGDSAVFTIAGSQSRCALDASGRIIGVSIPAQGVVVRRVSGAAAARISLGKPDYGAPAGAPYRAEEVTVQTPMGHVLTGTLTLPSGVSGKVPAVVTITGSGQEDRDEFIPIVPGYRLFRQVADTLGRRGIAVLRLDDRGINGSGGDLVKATSADFADDIRAGVAYLRKRAEVDGARIALVGHSEGGMIGPMIAATDPTIKAVVLMAGPAYTGQRIIDFQIKNSVEGSSSIPAAKRDSATAALRTQFVTAANAWTKYFLAYDPIPTLRKVKQPVLILQGATDQQVTPEQAPIIEKTLRESGNRDVTLRVFPERNHLFLHDPVGFPGDYAKLKSGKIDAEVMGALAEWLVVKLGGR